MNNDGEGFWVPNGVVDAVLPRHKAVGVAIYCVLARCETGKDYPSVNDLAEICLTTENKTENILDFLAEKGFLNYKDLLTIRGK